ncbi:DUF3800 domain-containing protein [Blastococcus sp. PRF04-17]|uniref:DUF3800 domain-containing protein n=1 Tax=Blastococcus sp. PRF04-17 TaxID=2933797 RepID=UPI001FF1A57E|nr:DUF3800 domain-containing protein [Blastococcus sp. PRF04-17]UOY03688.1 DUF3800 domain-containing protein [Blastococcus sp. PRF04-17]
MYLLALDESGTHNEAPVLLLAGLAVHEADVRPLERALHAVVAKHLVPLRLDPHMHEVHATDLKTPSRGKPARGRYPAKRPSEWLTVDASVRLAVLEDVYAALATFEPADPAYPLRLLGAVIDRGHKRYGGVTKAEAKAYDHVLHRFDEMLRRINKAAPVEQRGMVLHDRRIEHERRIQDQAAVWQRSGARLDALIQVPVFTDSRASRVIQAADLVAYALWRHYQPRTDDAHSTALWQLVDTNDRNEMSGVIHVTPKFGACPCPPCTSRTS